jgi:hypothetical protein
LSGLGPLEVAVRGESLLCEAVAPAFGDAGGAEVVVFYDPPSTATLHVYAREIADGGLMCSLGARGAAVRMDVRLAARIVTEGLARGLVLPSEEAQALRDALAQNE